MLTYPPAPLPEPECVAPNGLRFSSGLGATHSGLLALPVIADIARVTLIRVPIVEELLQVVEIFK